MTSKLTITDERLAELVAFRPLPGTDINSATRDEWMAMAAELQERRKADSEPVGEFYEEGPLNWYQISDGDRVPASRRIPLYRHAQPAKGLELAGWQFKSVNGDWLGLIDEHGKNQAVRDGCEVREVFAMADGVNERDQVRREHAEWSQSTFGNVGPVGPLKHLSKEALEAAAEPGDLSEWADMQFLLWDAQRRAGITDEQITKAMIDKLAVNKQRSWPEPKDGEPRLHIKEQPAPVVPVVPVVPATLPCSVELKPGLIIGKGCKTETLLTALRRRADYNADIDAMTPEERAEHDASIKAFKAMLAAATQSPGSEPPTVPGKWIPVSERIPDNTEPVLCIEKRADFGAYGQPFVCWHDGGGWVGKTNYRPIVTHWMPLPTAPQEVKK